MLRGVDLSSWQAGFDFQQAANEGYEFAIIKRTGGTSYRNPFFRNMIAAAQAAGMEIGTYAYLLEPTGDPGEPEAEADFFCDALPDGWNMPIFMDCEEQHARFPDLNDYYVRYRQRTRARTRIRPVGLYIGNYWVQEQNLKDPRLGESPLWLASWQENKPPVPAGAAWDTITLWQNASRATVGGMFPVDTNIFYGTREDWRALGRPDQPDVIQIVKESLTPVEYREALPTGYELHPYFWATWKLEQHGYPLGPGALYDDGRIRQLFERVTLGSNGRDEPIPNEGLGQAYHAATGRTIVDWPSVHPLVAAGQR